MKHKISIFIVISVLFFVAIQLNSCRKDFSFKEFDNLSDSIHLTGAIAVPLINTELSIKDALPSLEMFLDSSLWIELDEQDLIHLKMYYKDLHVIKMSDIFNNTPFPIPQGVLVPKDSVIVQSDTSKMKIYDKMFGGKLFFRNPKIRFYISNNIPLATFFRMDTLDFYKSDGTLLSNNEHISYSIDAPANSGETVKDTILIDKSVMPVLPDAFSPIPKLVSFMFSAGSHLDQNLPFAVDGNEEMHIDAEIDLPLDARLDTILLADTIPLPENWIGENIKQIKEANLRVLFSNGFPIDAYTQIYFADTLVTGEIGNNIDSIFNEHSYGWHLESAGIDAAGNVTTPNKTEPINITLDQSRLQQLVDSHATRVVVVAYVNTKNVANGNYVRLRGSDKISVKIGFMAKYEGDSNDIPNQ